MKLHQLSVSLQDRPDCLSRPCKALADAAINILTLSLGDTPPSGVLRLIVRDWERAREVLQEAGFAVRVTEVLAIEVSDRPGGIEDVLKLIEAAGLRLEFMYPFPVQRQDKAILAFRFSDPDAAIRQLQPRGVNILSPFELYERLER